VLEERRLEVLRAIVEDYVATQEPVGSKTLVERHNLAVSPATVRNDMAALEEEGFIAQPHTSAGRIPTDKGYRLFVDRLATVRPLSAPERRAISTFVQYPSLTRSTVRHVELVTLSANRLLVVLITSTGRVEQRVVETVEAVGETLIGDLRARINLASLGERLVDAADRLAEIPETFEPADRPIVTAVTSALVEAFSDERSDERVAVGGTANLSHFGDDFDLSIRPMLEALEEHVVLLQLLGAASSPRALTVRIGHEVPYEELSSTSIVASGYGPHDDSLATLGVVGPTRMDYPGAMAAVRAVAHYLSRRLSEE